jgi:exopolysaccharide biosynthesis polyprenyl glycosylphosphotransferase
MLGSSHKITLRRVSAVVNAAVVLFTLIAVFIAVNWHEMPSGLGDFLAMRITVKNLLVVAIFLTGGALTFQAFGLAAPPLSAPLGREIVRIIKACTVAGVFAVLFPLTSHSGAFSPRIAYYFLPTAILACLCGRLVARICTRPLATALVGRRDVIIIGAGASAAKLYHRVLESSPDALRVLGFVHCPIGQPVSDETRSQIIGNVADLETILMRMAVDEVLIALPADSCYPQIQAAITTCERAGVEARYFFSDMFELSVAKPAFERDEYAPVVRLKVVHDDARLLVKRAIDIAGAVAGIVLLGPLMLLITAAIKLSSPGPAIFVQERYGFHKRLFRMYKYRTMVPDAERLQMELEARNEVPGPVFKIRHDPRITPLGRLLRKTSLDELPQLFNVLRGDMSLVGPRPLPKRDVSRFDNASLMRRFSVKPGLTCLWQINGRSDTDFDRWIELDLRYIDTWSLSLDFMILAKTVPTVLAGRGAA